MALSDALRLTHLFVGWAILLQVAEFLWIQQKSQGLSIWGVSRKQGLWHLLFLAICALGLMITGYPVFTVLTALSYLVLCARLGGSFNGGSDYMTMVVLLGLSLGFWTQNLFWAKAGLTYIAVQSCFSYLIAGVTKLRESDWRSGLSLQRYLSSSPYQVPPRLRAFANRPQLCRVASWGLIAWEILFIGSLTHQAWAAPFLVSGVVFHLLLAWAFGLNRFFWAWLASYPAIWWLCHW